MGYVSRHKRRDFSKYETVYEDPDYDRLAAALAPRPDDKITNGMLAGGTTIETLGGLAAVVLSLIGFQSRPIEMCSIATIAIGVALLSQGATVMARWRQAMRRLERTRVGAASELVEGVSTEVFGGVVGIILGVIALVGIKPEV